MVQVYIDKEDSTKEFSFTGLVSDLCTQIQLNQEEIIVTRDGELLLANEKVENSDYIKILYVLSGG